jgi:hypothetical protein
MYGDHEHCIVDEFAYVWCLSILTFDVCWIVVVYMFSFWY